VGITIFFQMPKRKGDIYKGGHLAWIHLIIWGILLAFFFYVGYQRGAFQILEKLFKTFIVLQIAIIFFNIWKQCDTFWILVEYRVDHIKAKKFYFSWFLGHLPLKSLIFFWTGWVINLEIEVFWLFLSRVSNLLYLSHF